MKALIIGGAGFVGSYLIDHLRDECKWSISVTKMQHENINKKDIDIFDLNILIKDDIINLLNEIKPDYIFHLAAQSSVGLSWENPALTIDVNIKGTVNLLDAVREIDYNPKILLIGSGEEYGHIRQDETPVKEENATRPGNIYAATKVTQNLIGKIYADAYQMNIVMVRAFNHIGPNQAPIFVVADFCKQVAEIEKGMREPVLKVGNLDSKRDFTDVRDVVRAYGLLMKSGKKGEIYNVGSGKAVSIKSILDMILSMSNVIISIEVDKNKLRPIDIPIIEADVTKIKEATGWQNNIKLEETIADTLKYWRLNIDREKR